MDVAEYCREVEDYLCRKNQGHLVRVVGPAFERVRGWAEDGVPLKLVFRVIDERCERYYTGRLRRRPLRIEYCDAEVRDQFDAWRRAIGVTGPGHESAAASRMARGRSSLPAHLDRAVIRLTAMTTSSTTPGTLAQAIDQMLTELAKVRGAARRARGTDRLQLLDTLENLDAQLQAIARETADPTLVDAVRRDASDDLRPFRTRMEDAAFADAVERATARLLIERLGLPQLRF